MSERERRADNKRRTEIAMMRLLIKQYPQQALDQLREMQSRAKTVGNGQTKIVVQSA